MEIDGSCLCGDVNWRAKINPENVGICHCTQCQINSSSGFSWVASVATDDFELLSGELRVFVKTAESGNQRALSFCPNCGTTIYGGNVEGTGLFSLRLGGCTQRDQLEPKVQLWHRSAVPWLEGLDLGQSIETQGGI